ncbi:hypothetical protein CNECB9_460013 [Cupriavidus necator]|uniref:Uncharacterized protein n=1 Tax=Cupriavidus necator TaxID=106590 RepID=A0A1K0ILK1_CUPNE|nr:hypothetical protein CNECB9_460013 [Cupriavidus necator]
MQTISLFPQGALDPIEDKADLAIRAILEAGHPLVLAYSGGKDSSMVAALATARRGALPCCGRKATGRRDHWGYPRGVT